MSKGFGLIPQTDTKFAELSVALASKTAIGCYALKCIIKYFLIIIFRPFHADHLQSKKIHPG